MKTRRNWKAASSRFETILGNRIAGEDDQFIHDPNSSFHVPRANARGDERPPVFTRHILKGNFCNLQVLVVSKI
jgi:hypothetical protein